MLEKLRELVDFAYENVTLYRRLYQRRPQLKSMQDFRRLPCLTRGDFALCDVADVLSDMDEAMVILPPVENRTIFPFPRLESATDRDSRYEVFYFLLKQAGVTDGATFLIITDTCHSYYCGEIANNLLYYGHPTWMMVMRGHSGDELRMWINRFEPDYLLLGLDRLPGEVMDCGVPHILTINWYDRDLSSESRISHLDIYAITEIGWIGIRPPGGHYMYPREYFFIETDPGDDIITVTALESKLQPFIRYKTGDRGEILGDGKLYVRYIGEH